MSGLKITRSTENETGYVFSVMLNRQGYTVMLSKDYYQKLTGGNVEPEELIDKTFQFLLKREKQEQIMKEFELSVINQYFPEYESAITKSIHEN